MDRQLPEGDQLFQVVGHELATQVDAPSARLQRLKQPAAISSGAHACCMEAVLMLWLDVLAHADHGAATSLTDSSSMSHKALFGGDEQHVCSVFSHSRGSATQAIAAW